MIKLSKQPSLSKECEALNKILSRREITKQHLDHIRLSDRIAMLPRDTSSDPCGMQYLDEGL